MILIQERKLRIHRTKTKNRQKTLLTEKYYVNPAKIHISFPIKINKQSNSSDIDSGLITVNNFFAHCVKEISITKYSSDKELPSTFSPWDVYQYSD